MPPKTKISNEDIINAALDITREGGIASLNARALAKRLKCSTQPIFSNYTSMQEIKEEVMQRADKIYQGYLEKEMTNGKYPVYKASGMAYIKFAREEKELFKLLFMRDRSNETVKDEREKISDIIQIIAKSTGMSEEQAYLFHLEMWIYAHGMATMIATSYLEWDEEMTSNVMTDAYEGLKTRFIK